MLISDRLRPLISSSKVTDEEILSQVMKISDENEHQRRLGQLLRQKKTHAHSAKVKAGDWQSSDKLKDTVDNKNCQTIQQLSAKVEAMTHIVASLIDQQVVNTQVTHSLTPLPYPLSCPPSQLPPKKIPPAPTEPTFYSGKGKNRLLSKMHRKEPAGVQPLLCVWRSRSPSSGMPEAWQISGKWGPVSAVGQPETGAQPQSRPVNSTPELSPKQPKPDKQQPHILACQSTTKCKAPLVRKRSQLFDWWASSNSPI